MGTHANLYLEFKEKQDHTTYVSQQYFNMPLQITTPFYTDGDGSAFVYLLNPSGGMLEGDRFELRFDLETGARVLLATPSANKIYKTSGDSADQTITITQKDHSILEYLPKHNVPYANSVYRQQTDFNLSKSSTLFTWDAVSAGRATRGEVFDYASFQSRLRFFVDDRLVLQEQTLIEPKALDLSSIGILEQHQIYAACYLHQPGLSIELLDILKDTASAFSFVMYGVSMPCRDFAVIKLLTDKVWQAEEVMHALWRAVRLAVLGKPARML